MTVAPPATSAPMVWVVRNHLGNAKAVCGSEGLAREVWMHRTTAKAPWSFAEETYHPAMMEEMKR